jgi:hypothetical protein
VRIANRAARKGEKKARRQPREAQGKLRRGKVKHLPFALDGGTHAFIRNAQGDDAFPAAEDCRESLTYLLGNSCRPKRALASWRGIFELS